MSHSNNTGTNIEAIMMIPPIVGVPAFWFCPSKYNDLTLSPIWRRRKTSMSFLPKTIVMSSDNITAAAERNEM
jgi:hypothetical protein